MPLSIEPEAASRLGHKPVLLHETIEYLNVEGDNIVVDATLGGGGHSREILKHLNATGALVCIDADREAIERAEEYFAHDARIHVLHANFRHLEEELRRIDVDAIDKALFDLGWSGYQLTAGRGFSFQADEKLDMRYGEGEVTAETIVNHWSSASIEDILRGFGEERYARRISQAIQNARETRPIQTARELAEIVRSAVPPSYRHGKIHPATKTFQALRIAVNDEIGALTQGLEAACRMLKAGGRIAVISFHSIEDRVVKRAFLTWEKEGKGERITKRPITASAGELQENPRSRSAKMRVFQKV